MTRLIDAEALKETLNAAWEDNVLSTLCDAVNLITDAPTVQREGWVSVEDRLPEFTLYAGEPLKVNGQDIPPLFRSDRVMYVAEGIVFVGKLDKLNSTIMPSGVTYWQALPDAPKLNEVK